MGRFRPINEEFPMTSRFLSACLAFACSASPTLAQLGLPLVSQSIPDVVLTPGGSAQTVDLRNHFTLNGVSGQIVQFTTVSGNFNVEMLATAAPTTVTNFLGYVNRNDYNDTVIHRSSRLTGTGNGIVQGGAYTYALPLGAVATQAAIPLEYNLPNTRGTIAMARTSSPDSATSQWFFNLADNSSILGSANGGGYAVFGRVIGTGMTVLDAIGALPIYNLGSPLTEMPLRNVQQGQTQVQLQNLVAISRVAVVPAFPTAGSTASVASFNSSVNSNPEIVGAQITGSELRLTPVAAGVATITIVATDTDGNTARTSFRVGVAATGQVALPPANQSPELGGTATFSVTVAGPASAYQWSKNGAAIAGATASSHTVANVQSSDAGLYTVTVTTPAGTVTSQAGILAPVTTQKVAGAAYEHTANIRHPNGRFYDQLLLTGPSATFTADADQVTRLSYVDLNDDIVQVEFSGAGAVTLVLDGASGPANPVNYNQSSVTYMKGHASLYVANAGANTYISSFTVGRLTAFDPTGAYDITKPASGANNPANNGNPIFKAGTSYDGIADLGVLAIASPTNRFGGILSANTHYWRDRGSTGIYAPDVILADGRAFFQDLSARDTAKPILILGSASDVRVTGGDLRQDNNQAVEVHGFTQLRFTAGTDSHGNSLPAQTNQGRLVNRAGADVTAQLVTGG
ncbi:MAG: hypothetical protein C0502_08165 [Opitutus sp.]|nr:hypothetical protein [Opitutus sp.]